MKKNSILSVMLAFLIFLFINSCASTSLKSVWTDDSYQGGPFRKLLVVGVMEPQSLREFFEDEFVRRMNAAGVQSVASHTVFPDGMIPAKGEMDVKIAEMGLDSIVVSRLIDVKDTSIYETYPPLFSASGYYGYYIFCCQNIVSLGYTVEFETKLFAAKNDKLVWSALSETAIERSSETIMTSYIATIMKEFKGRNFIH